MAYFNLFGHNAVLTRDVQFQGIWSEWWRKRARSANQYSFPCRLVQKSRDQRYRRGGDGAVFAFRVLKQHKFAFGTSLVFQIVRAAQLPDGMFDGEGQV